MTTDTNPVPKPELLLPGVDLPLDAYSKAGVIVTDKDADGNPTHKVNRFPSAVLEEEWKSNTPTVRERAMMRVIDLLTDKPGWVDKLDNDEIISKWRAEALALPFKQGFTDKMFDWVVAELRDKAVLFKKNGGVVSVYDGAAAVFKTDNALTQDLMARLQEQAAKLEGDDKDWHPGSNDQVLDLVHPSLFPLVYGKTRFVRSSIPLGNALATWGSGEVIPKTETPVKKKDNWHYGHDPERLLSRNFQWLPTDVELKDGKARFTSYINNLHPEEHAEMYGVLEELVEKAVPLWSATYNRVMTWIGADDGKDWEDRENTVNRIWCMDSNRTCTTPKVCKNYCDAWNNPNNPENQSNQEEDEDEDEDEGSASEDSEVANVGSEGDAEMDSGNMPEELSDLEDSDEEEEGDEAGSVSADATDAEDESEVDRAAPADGDLPPLDGYDSEDEANQIWFEATHKVTQPEPLDEYKYVGYPFTQPVWKDKKLQVIIKLANIHLTPEKPSYSGGSWHIEGQLNERIVATALYYYDNDNITDSHLSFRTACDSESLCENFEYGQNDHSPFTQIFGANPGLDAHSTVLEFGKVLTCEDKSKVGHRKIVALFLVDPDTPVIGTANVPPQQMYWGVSPVEPRLPPEVAEMVYEHVSCPFKLDEAKKLRLELMDERRAIDRDANKAVNSGDFSFCEH
ncbi:hypothetical protein CspHIS471_0410300 [Cutaneotrichosporon sp. HIS471]|nr:hypothetical protein CspHIS471_0410300 [Cutaneotrichosporon sp. HIS471]